MDILRIYNKIIETGQTRVKKKGDFLHRHRIVPSHAGGQYTPDNITYLTPKEHRLVHLLRYKLYGAREDIFAYIRLRGSFSGHTHKEKTKEKISEKMKGRNNPFYGKKHTEESKKKIRAAREKQIFTEESIKKRGRTGSLNGRYGKPVTEETRAKIGQANKGKKRTAEQLKKASEVRKGLFEGAKNPMARSVIIDGITYNTIKEATLVTGLTYYQIKKIT
jgi:hypothetical protein